MRLIIIILRELIGIAAAVAINILSLVGLIVIFKDNGIEPVPLWVIGIWMASWALGMYWIAKGRNNG